MTDATPESNGQDPRIDALIDVVAANSRDIAALTSDIASLTRVVRLHLIHDHGYDEPDDDDQR